MADSNAAALDSLNAGSGDALKITVTVSGPDNPTTLNFLPDNHIVVLREADLVGGAVYFWKRNVLLTIVVGMLAYLPLHLVLG